VTPISVHLHPGAGGHFRSDTALMASQASPRVIRFLSPIHKRRARDWTRHEQECQMKILLESQTVLKKPEKAKPII